MFIKLNARNTLHVSSKMQPRRTYVLFFLRGDMAGEDLVFEEFILDCEPEPAPDIDNAVKRMINLVFM